MIDTLHRHWHMLSAIPRRPRKVTVDALRNHLADLGYNVTTRTIQRDLENLSSRFPLVRDDRDKPFGWSWARDAQVLDIPGMDAQTALTFRLADAFLSPLLAPAMRAQLQPHMAQASQVLNDTPLDNLARHIRIIPHGQPLQPPPMAPEVLDAVYRGLIEQRQLSITYRTRKTRNGETRTARASPLGLVFRDAVAYLVCCFWNYTDPRLLALHRLDQAQLEATPSHRPAGFNLDVWLTEKGFVMGSGKAIRLVARFTRGAALHLQEGGLSEDQQLTPIDEHWIRLEASVRDTGQLQWWLLGFGAQVEVLEPQDLRKKMASVSKQMADLYT